MDIEGKLLFYIVHCQYAVMFSNNSSYRLNLKVGPGVINFDNYLLICDWWIHTILIYRLKIDFRSRLLAFIVDIIN